MNTDPETAAPSEGSIHAGTLCPIYRKYDMTMVTRMPLSKSGTFVAKLDPRKESADRLDSFVAQGFRRKDTRGRPRWIEGRHQRNTDRDQGHQRTIDRTRSERHVINGIDLRRERQ